MTNGHYVYFCLILFVLNRANILSKMSKYGSNSQYIILGLYVTIIIFNLNIIYFIFYVLIERKEKRKFIFSTALEGVVERVV